MGKGKKSKKSTKSKKSKSKKSKNEKKSLLSKKNGSAKNVAKTKTKTSKPKANTKPKAPKKKTAAKKTSTSKTSTSKTSTIKTAGQIPVVEYLKLGAKPYLSAYQCKGCDARFFDRRNACASCGTTEFKKARVKSKGKVTSFTIVHFAAPTVEVPFVSATIDCDGTSVRGNIINVEPVPEKIQLGMNVELATYSIGTDGEGTECIGFGFQPA